VPWFLLYDAVLVVVNIRRFSRANRTNNPGRRRPGRGSIGTWAIESGVQASYLAVVMGTSIRELEDTYFRWLRRTDDQFRAVFDEYDARAAV
jgi:hypothetical protein